MDSLEHVIVVHMDDANVVYIEFGDKSSWPKGTWLKEPDYCAWESYGYKCILLRDMKLGIWRGFVGITKEHPFYNKTLADMLNEKIYLYLTKVHGGVSFAGRFAPKSKTADKKLWWFGFECMQEDDLIPTVGPIKPAPGMVVVSQTYRSFTYARSQTIKLAQELTKLQQLTAIQTD